MTALFGFYLLGAGLTGLFLLGRAHTRPERFEVALTALLWPLYATVIGGGLVLALCGILVFWVVLAFAWVDERVRYRRRR